MKWHLNTKQRIILLLGVAFFLLSELFPPWLYVDEYDSAQRSVGYHFLYAPPLVKSSNEMKEIFSIPADSSEEHLFRVKVDTFHLFAQRIIIVFLTGGLLLILKDRKSLIWVILGGVSLCIG